MTRFFPILSLLFVMFCGTVLADDSSAVMKATVEKADYWGVLRPFAVAELDQPGGADEKLMKKTVARMEKLAEGGNYLAASRLAKFYRVLSKGSPERLGRAAYFYKLAAELAPTEEDRKLAESCGLYCKFAQCALSMKL